LTLIVKGITGRTGVQGCRGLRSALRGTTFGNGKRNACKGVDQRRRVGIVTMWREDRRTNLVGFIIVALSSHEALPSSYTTTNDRTVWTRHIRPVLSFTFIPCCSLEPQRRCALNLVGLIRHEPLQEAQGVVRHTLDGSEPPQEKHIAGRCWAA
jgi:hypothetical protein